MEEYNIMWKPNCLTMIDPASGNIVTQVLPPAMVDDWCRANLSSPFGMIWDISNGRYDMIFNSKDDATMFELRWKRS